MHFSSVKFTNLPFCLLVLLAAVSCRAQQPEEEPEVPDTIKLEKISSTSSTVTLGWKCSWAADSSVIYRVYAFSDASCASAVYAFSLSSDKFGGGDPRFIFTGLDSDRTYWFAVRDNLEHSSNVLAVETDSFTPVEVGKTAVGAGGTLLAEDFSQLVYGGDCVDSACGYAPDTIAGGKTTSKYIVDKFTRPSGEDAVGFTVETCDRQYTMGLQLALAVRDDSRLSEWLYQSSTNTFNRAMCRPGYVAISNVADNPGYLMTPALDNLESAATVTVRFKAAAFGTTDCKVGLAHPEVTVPSEGTPRYGYGAVTKGTVDVRETFVLTREWKEYSLTLANVACGSRIAFGTDVKTATASPLILLDDIRITVDTYKSVLPAWKKGYMDIHFLSSWTGESLFIVYPDGTTMAIDAAGDDSATNNPVIRSNWEAQKAGITKNCGTALICDYIRHFLDEMGKDRLDYVMLTHYHPDHMGTYHSTAYTGYTVKKTSKAVGTGSSQWTLNGITMLMENFTVGKYVDRDYSPDRDLTHSYPMQLYVKKPTTLKDQTSTVYPVPENTSAAYVKQSMMNNYRYMIRSIEDNKWTTIEKFDVGSATQFQPLYDASCGVEVRNLGAQGVFWTGSGTSTSQVFPTGDDIKYKVPSDGSSIDKDGTYGYNCPAENHNSCCLRFTWGKFTFGTLGDNTWVDCGKFPWKDAEKPIAEHIGQCDVLKANHHGLYGCTSAALADAAKPLVWVVDNWNDSQGDRTPVSLLPSDTKMYFTNMTDEIRNELADYSSRILGTDGHVVVRVYDNGDRFRVYMLDRVDEKYKVLSESEAYVCQ